MERAKDDLDIRELVVAIPVGRSSTQPPCYPLESEPVMGGLEEWEAIREVTQPPSVVDLQPNQVPEGPKSIRHPKLRYSDKIPLKECNFAHMCPNCAI